MSLSKINRSCAANHSIVIVNRIEPGAIAGLSATRFEGNTNRRAAFGAEMSKIANGPYGSPNVQKGGFGVHRTGDGSAAQDSKIVDCDSVANRNVEYSPTTGDLDAITRIVGKGNKSPYSRIYHAAGEEIG